MRISDWSSDVCSSDLRCRAQHPGPVPIGAGGAQHRDARPSTASYRADRRCRPLRSPADPASSGSVMMERHQILELMGDLKLAGMRHAYDEVIADAIKRQYPAQHVVGDLLQAEIADRSEEHTSELQSLMRI